MEDKKTVEMKPIIGKKKEVKKTSGIPSKPVTPQKPQEPVDMEEQYKGLVSQLYERNQQLVEALNEKNTAMMFKRIDYLFKVLEQSHMFSDEFVTKCIDELEKTLDVNKVEENTENGEQDQ